MKKTAIALFVLLLATGCFEVDRSIELKKDMSGTADFHLGVDLEPMVVIMAQMSNSMEGKGPLTAEELAKAKADFKKSGKSSGDKPSRDDIEKSLPPGVKLLDFAATEREFGLDTKFKFGFDKLQSLVSVKFPQKEGSDPTQKNIIDSPFEGLEVLDNGETFTIQSKAQNPTDTVKEEAAERGPKLDADIEKLMREAFAALRVAYHITAPFEVVSHNATRVEGKTLVWEYNLEAFEKSKEKHEDPQIHVTYKK